MNRKTILGGMIGLIVMLGIGAGFFLWQNQKDVKEVNKNLPAGIKVVKGLFSSDDYVVVNKIDGYEFKLPKEWKGVKDVEYTPEKNEKGYSWTVFGIEGQAGYSKIFAITKFKTIGSLELHSWVERPGHSANSASECRELRHLCLPSRNQSHHRGCLRWACLRPR